MAALCLAIYVLGLSHQRVAQLAHEYRQQVP